MLELFSLFLCSPQWRPCSYCHSVFLQILCSMCRSGITVFTRPQDSVQVRSSECCTVKRWSLGNKFKGFFHWFIVKWHFITNPWTKSKTASRVDGSIPHRKTEVGQASSYTHIYSIYDFSLLISFQKENLKNRLFESQKCQHLVKHINLKVIYVFFIL